MADLTSLPPPPTGQTGITLGALKGLPPPPSGQKGMTLSQVQTQTPAIAPPAPNLGQMDATQVTQGTQHITDAIQRGGAKFAADTANPTDASLGTEFKRTGDLLETGLGAAAGASQAVFAPFTAILQKVLSNSGGTPSITAPTAPTPLQPAIDSLKGWAQQHPDAARNLMDAVTVGSTAAGDVSAEDILNTNVGKATKDASQAFSQTPRSAISSTKTAASNFANSSAKSSIDSLEKTYEELLTGNKTRNAKFDDAQAATEAKNKAGTTGQTPQRVLAEAGIIPKQTGSQLRTAQQADDFRESVQPLRETNRNALKELEYATPPVNLNDVEKEALTHAGSEENINNGTADSLQREIQAEFAGLRQHYGDTIPLTKLDDVKSARWGKVPFDSNRPYLGNANYLIAKASQKIIEKTASGAGFEDVAQLNRHIGDRLEAAKFLESLDGKTLKGGRLGRYALQITGSTLGHTIPGKIVGALGGEVVANMLISNSVAGPVKRLILRTLKDNDPSTYKSAVQWLDKQGVLRESRPKLMPANNNTPMPMGAGNTSRTKVFDDYDEFLKAQGIQRKPADLLQLPAPGSSAIRLPNRSVSSIDAQEMARLKLQRQIQEMKKESKDMTPRLKSQNTIITPPPK